MTQASHPDTTADGHFRSSAGIDLHQDPVIVDWIRQPPTWEHQIGLVDHSKKLTAICQSTLPSGLADNIATMVWQEVHCQTIHKKPVVMGLGHRLQHLGSCCTQFKPNKPNDSSTVRSEQREFQEPINLHFEYAWRVATPIESLLLAYQLCLEIEGESTTNRIASDQLTVALILPSLDVKPEIEMDTAQGGETTVRVPQPHRVNTLRLSLAAEPVVSQDNPSVISGPSTIECLANPPSCLDTDGKHAFKPKWLVISAPVPQARKFPQTLLWTVNFQIF